MQGDLMRKPTPREILYKGVCPMCLEENEFGHKPMDKPTCTFIFGSDTVVLCDRHCHEFVNGFCKEYAKSFPDRFQKTMDEIKNK